MSSGSTSISQHAYTRVLRGSIAPLGLAVTLWSSGCGAPSDSERNRLATSSQALTAASVPADVCACQACSGHGSCVVQNGQASCRCDSGYSASGTSCAQTPLNSTRTLYVSPTGNDGNSGLTTSAQLKTIARAVAKAASGDVIKLQAGATFNETINIPWKWSASSVGTVTFSSDAANRARISVPTGQNGIKVYDASNLTFENLIITGPGMDSTRAEGVVAQSDGQYQNLTFRNVEVSGFYRGVYLTAWGSTNGVANAYSNVLIDACKVHDNRDDGILTWADGIGAHKNVIVRRSEAYNNLGDPSSTHPSGSGIVLGNVADSLIENSVAHHNGGSGTNSAGPVGIWTYSSRRVTIQYNESYANKAQKMDGDGFDLDVGVTDSVLQYNYSHDNYGAGYLMCHDSASTWNNNVVRYNVSENDAWGGKMASLSWCTGNMTNSYTYGNLFYNSVGPVVNPTWDASASGHKVFNNVFVAANGHELIWSWGGLHRFGVMQFQGNLYWSSSSTPNFEGYTSLVAWRTATGQEKLNGASVGQYADPQLSTYVPACTAAGGTLARALPKFRVSTTSPVIDKALTPTQFVTNPGSRDYWGTSLPQGSAYDVGAQEVTTPTTPPPSSSCTDGIKNGTETDVDCGGSCAIKCATNKACSQAADCQTGICTGGVCEAPANNASPSCSDGIRNGAEVGIDCGGSCSKCALGQTCRYSWDCASDMCSAEGRCISCSDNVKNGYETDVDCGGFYCSKCSAGKSCDYDWSCSSNRCVNNVCQ